MGGEDGAQRGGFAAASTRSLRGGTRFVSWGLEHRNSAQRYATRVWQSLMREIAVGSFLRDLFPGVADLRGQERARPVLYVRGHSQRRLGWDYVAENRRRAGGHRILELLAC